MFDRLIPILYVENLEAERDFYISLGFTLTYQGTEFPDFIALGYGLIEFGLERREGFSTMLPERVLIWQFGVKDIEDAKRLLQSVDAGYQEEWVIAREDWKYRVLHAHTPNGYHLMLEGPGE